LTSIVSSSAADQGVALYKTKCSGCHGANGEGNRGANTKREPNSKASHNNGMSAVSDEQAKAVCGLHQDYQIVRAAFRGDDLIACRAQQLK
jgi:mono/diheme cytochrome c family protein